jgi:putative peptide zinc metalloprotease protein
VPVDRTTFSESWYRVASLRPRLRSTVQVSRQHFRGRMWHVLHDPASNQFFRLNNPAYAFVALLDGRRTVADAWRMCNDQLGDNAPTQGEAIQLLGQLYTSNLLHAELPPDTESLFRRYRRRVTREVKGYMMNLLFIRIPLLDPDHFLDRWVGVFGSVFSVTGFVIWILLIAAGLYAVAGRTEELVNRASGVLSLGNLPLLYVALVLVKVCHEFGHAFACKKFGRKAGTGGEVHVMGVMFLVFTPLPYVDASSAWAFRRKWHRVIVGTSGMMVELGIAGIAAVIWFRTSAGHPLHALTYNMMFIASVSTILFNGNPLLRYDGYYILSDLLEMPNLAQRSRAYLYYLVRRYVWRVRRAQSPAHTKGERGWLAAYAIASTLYRVFICVAILLFVAGIFPLVGALLAALAVSAWVVVPLGKFAHYLMTHGELERVRPWAIGSTLLVLGLLLGAIGLIPAPDRYRIDGVVEPRRLAFVHAATDGFVRGVPDRTGPAAQPGIGGYVLAASGERVEVGDSLFKAENRALEAEYRELRARRREFEHQKSLAESREDWATAQAAAEKIAAVQKQIDRVREERAALSLRALESGRWIAPGLEHARGAYLRRGERVGLIASVDDLIVRAVAGQDAVGPLYEEIGVRGSAAARRVELCVKGRPDLRFTGRITHIAEAGKETLPSAALGYLAGGSVQTTGDDRTGTKATERFFEIRVRPDPVAKLLSGQRVVVRAELSKKPLAVQWWRSIRQLFQRRFHI